MNISPHLLIDAGILSAALTITLVLRAKSNTARKEKESKWLLKRWTKIKLFKIWNFLIYGSSIAIGVFLVYLYSTCIFINK